MDDRQLTGRRRWPAAPLLALVALAAGGLTGGLIVTAGSRPEATAAERAPGPVASASPAAAGAVPLADASYAVHVQALASALTAWAAQAGAVDSHQASHLASVPLRRHETALEAVALAADAGASDPRVADVARLARDVAARAAAARGAAHAERADEAGVVALRVLAGEVALTGVWLRESLAALAAAPDPSAYAVALAAIAAEIGHSEPDAIPAAPPTGGAQPGDDPVPASP